MTPDHKIPEEREMKPLFIPLKSEYYEAFANGKKKQELRIMGPRWNSETCRPGRHVVLSKGYGKKNRLQGFIHRIDVMRFSSLSQRDAEAIIACYGPDAEHRSVIIIHIRNIKPAVQP